jgi:hypothetical protein
MAGRCEPCDWSGWVSQARASHKYAMLSPVDLASRDSRIRLSNAASISSTAILVLLILRPQP